MVLCEIKNYKRVIKDTFRILKPNGLFIFSVVHPAYALRNSLLSLDIIMPSRNYFDSRKSTFKLGEVRVSHFNRTIEEYFDELKNIGFDVEKVLEPPYPKKIIDKFPKYMKYADCPLSLIFKAKKKQQL